MLQFPDAPGKTSRRGPGLGGERRYSEIFHPNSLTKLKMILQSLGENPGMGGMHTVRPLQSGICVMV